MGYYKMLPILVKVACGWHRGTVVSTAASHQEGPGSTGERKGEEREDLPVWSVYVLLVFTWVSNHTRQVNTSAGALEQGTNRPGVAPPWPPTTPSAASDGLNAEITFRCKVLDK